VARSYDFEMIRPFLLAAVLLGSASILRAEDAPAALAGTPPVVQAASKDEVMALAGKVATVMGKITRVGSTTAGGITFLNFAGPANGFVAVVYKSNYAGFPDGFDKYKGQTVRVTGKVVIYKETTPQIVLREAKELEVVAAAEAAPSPEASATPEAPAKPEASATPMGGLISPVN